MIACDLQRAGVGVRSLAEPVVDTKSDFPELVLAMLGVAAKLGRDRIKERTKFGRKPKPTLHQQREPLKRFEGGNETLWTIALSYSVSHLTIPRLQAHA